MWWLQLDAGRRSQLNPVLLGEHPGECYGGHVALIDQNLPQQPARAPLLCQRALGDRLTCAVPESMTADHVIGRIRRHRDRILQILSVEDGQTIAPSAFSDTADMPALTEDASPPAKSGLRTNFTFSPASACSTRSA